MKILFHLKTPLTRILRVLNNISLFRYAFDFIFDFALSRTSTVEHRNITLLLSSPNQLINYRLKTFSTKEPETLRWIDELTSADVLWDIGANIGLYSCYAASQGVTVVAFEPSYLNIHSLVTNISLNKLSGLVTFVPIPLSDKNQIARFNSRFLRFGSALSSFAENIGYDGKAFTPSLDYSIPGLTIDSCLQAFGLPAPTAIKIDVDGLEHLILKGAATSIRTVRTILIEVNDKFYEQSHSVNATLTSYGFKLMYKEHSHIIANSNLFDQTYNQIWVR